MINITYYTTKTTIDKHMSNKKQINSQIGIKKIPIHLLFVCNAQNEINKYTFKKSHNP